ncbi:MAG: DUF3500 domain-containing protein [Limisphaerales bacterium]
MKIFLKLLLCVFFLQSASLRAHTPAEEMAAAASHFLAVLTPKQRAEVIFDFKNEERANWHFIPKPRKGLPLKELTPTQTLLAQALLGSGLSQRGFVKAATIMSLEQVLHDLETKGPPRDPGLYYISIFGQPGGKEPWGWRWEGHHLSINFTIAAENISVTPSFFGANPAEVQEGERKGLRVLADEEDLARQLVKSFDSEQKKIAIISTNAPRDIITGNMRRAKALEIVGLPMTKMDEAQCALLKRLGQEYLYRHRPELAEANLKKIEQAGGDKIYFAWFGGTEPGQPHYYRIQGPTFLVEYDNTQNNANHVHAVWRDFENDFGEDLLRQHYETTPHP